MKWFSKLLFSKLLLKNSVYWRLFCIFTTVSIIELFDVWFISASFFGLPALLLTAAAAIAGTFLAVRQFPQHLKQLNSALDTEESPTVPFMNLVLTAVAIILILLPGLISDAAGFLLLVPPVRHLAVSHILLRYKEYRRSGHNKPQNNNNRQKPPDIIDI